jgi:hypothetical protein
MSNYNRHKFGLKAGMDVSRINKEFFYKRFSEAYNNHIAGNEANGKYVPFYAIAINGNTVNFILEEDVTKLISDSKGVNKFALETKEFDGDTWFVDNNGNKVIEKVAEN